MPVVIVELGMVLVILTGQIDISVGSQFAICSVAAGVFAHLGLPTPLAGVAACLVGAVMGAVNGALVAWVGIPSIVVTLATMVALRDGLRWVTQGAWVQDLPSDFQWFGQSQTASEIITIGLCGRSDRGDGMGAAQPRGGASGERHRVRLQSGAADGHQSAAGGLRGFVLIGVFKFSRRYSMWCVSIEIPSNAGIGLELKVIAAAVVGGVSISGGRGTIGGTMLGLLLLAIIGPALTFLGFSAYRERRDSRRHHTGRGFVGRDECPVREHAGIISAQRA